MIDPFEYIPPSQDNALLFKEVAKAISDAYWAVLQACPQSRERSLAVTKLQEARMWANAAISFDGKEVGQ